LIVETDASKKAIGAALIQEVKTEEVIERMLIYTASTCLKSAETRYSTIRRELFGVSFALKKFRKYLMGNHFLLRTDHRPLDGLFKKAITSIKNEDLRNLVAGLTEYSFDVEYVPGESNCFPDWLSRNCVDELYSYPDFRMGESGKFDDVFSRSKWRRFIPANERRSMLNSLHTLKHFGYTRMLAGAEEARFTWPLTSEDVKEFLTDCGCSLAKKNRRKKMKWGKPEEVLPEDNAFAMDVYSFGATTYLSILNLKDDQFWVQKYGKSLVNVSLP